MKIKCRSYADHMPESQNVCQIYAGNMQIISGIIHKICKKCAKYIQIICRKSNKYAKNMQQIAKNMQNIQKCICVCRTYMLNMQNA